MPRMHGPQTTRPATVPLADCAVAPCAASSRSASAAKAGTTSSRFVVSDGDTLGCPPYVETFHGWTTFPLSAGKRGAAATFEQLGRASDALLTRGGAFGASDPLDVLLAIREREL